MRKADLGIPHRLDGLRQAPQVLADRDHVSGGSAGLVAFETDPLDRRDKALLFVIRFGRKSGGHTRRLQEQEIHLTEDLLELGRLLGTVNRRLHVLRREHRNMLPNIRSIVKNINPKNCPKYPLTPPSSPPRPPHAPPAARHPPPPQAETPSRPPRPPTAQAARQPAPRSPCHART